MQKKFQVREMSYYSWNDHFGRYAFFQSVTIKDLSYKDKKTVNFAKHKIHGLTYQPLYREKAYAQDQVNNVLRRLYNQYKTRERTVVAYKGGHVEKDLLDKLDIRNLGLPQMRKVKANDCRTVIKLWFSFK